jgi:transcriptional regulator with XRE-family HTH domain
VFLPVPHGLAPNPRQCAPLTADAAIAIACIEVFHAPNKGQLAGLSIGCLKVSGQRMSQRGETYARLVFQGVTLKSLRQRQRLTLRALAQRLGVTHQAVHNWEKGINDPSADLLPIIAQELGCEIGDLYLGTVPPRSPTGRQALSAIRRTAGSRPPRGRPLRENPPSAALCSSTRGCVTDPRIARGAPRVLPRCRR